MKEHERDEFERALAVVVSIAARQDALQGLAMALERGLTLEYFPDRELARAALEKAKPFLEGK